MYGKYVAQCSKTPKKRKKREKQQQQQQTICKHRSKINLSICIIYNTFCCSMVFQLLYEWASEIWLLSVLVESFALTSAFVSLHVALYLVWFLFGRSVLFVCLCAYVRVRDVRWGVGVRSTVLYWIWFSVEFFCSIHSMLLYHVFILIHKRFLCFIFFSFFFYYSYFSFFFLQKKKSIRRNNKTKIFALFDFFSFCSCHFFSLCFVGLCWVL